MLGLAAVGLAVSSAVLLVTSYVATALPAALITMFIVCLFGGLWFAFPVARNRLCAPRCHPILRDRDG